MSEDEASFVDAKVRVRPALGANAGRISLRAALLMTDEWRDLGLIDDQPSDEGIDAFIRTRETNVPSGQIEIRRSPVAAAAGASSAPRPPLVTRVDGKVPADLRASDAPWPTFEGRLFGIGERAIIGWTKSGQPVFERFEPGSLVMATDQRVLVNRDHEKKRVVGHVTSIYSVAGEQRARGLIVDTSADGRDAYELARAESVLALSIEFRSRREDSTQTMTVDGPLITHHRALLTGLGIVQVPAYDSARLLSLFDRREAGRQREHERAKALARARRLNH